MNSEFQIFDSPEIESLKRKAAKEEKKTITLTEEQMKADNTFQMAMKLLHEVYRKIGGLEYFKECAYKVRFGEVSSYSECATNKIREAVKKEKDLKRDKMIQILLKAVDPDPRKRIDIEKILKSTE